jgi:hypothetical protein
MDDERQDSDLSGELQSAGTDLAGALVGTGVGLVAGGPPGAMLGAALGVAVQHATRAIVGRFNRREEERVGAALLIMEDDARRRESSGEQLRDDGFFDAHGALRPDAEELLEGVLRRSASTYEERKLPLLARLYSAVAHDQTISPSEGMYLVRIADELTYRQFVALSVIAHKDEYVRELAKIGAEHSVIGGPHTDPTMLRELSDLVDVRLVGISNNGRVGPLNNVFDGLRPRDKTSYGQLGLLPAGQQLVAATRADEIDVAEREAWLGNLRKDQNRQ